MKDREQGAWFEGEIVRIVKDPSYVPPEPIEETVNTKEDSENEPPSQSSSKSPPKKKGIAEYFSKMAKLSTRKKQIQNTQRHLEEKNSPECGLLYTVHLDAEYALFELFHIKVISKHFITIIVIFLISGKILKVNITAN